MVDSATLKRFWEKVKKGEPNECWEWQAGLDRCGYGGFSIDGKTTLAHRFSLSLVECIDNRYVLHTCDNPGCVNPEHLYLGSQSDNMRDMYERNRRQPPRGEANGSAKLTEAKVLEILEIYSAGILNQAQLAKKYGVGKTIVGDIVRRKRWTHLTNPAAPAVL